MSAVTWSPVDVSWPALWARVRSWVCAGSFVAGVCAASVVRAAWLASFVAGVCAERAAARTAAPVRRWHSRMGLVGRHHVPPGSWSSYEVARRMADPPRTHRAPRGWRRRDPLEVATAAVAFVRGVVLW